MAPTEPSNGDQSSTCAHANDAFHARTFRRGDSQSYACAVSLTDTEADLEAVSQIVPALSRDGKITPEGAQAVTKVLDVSSEKVRLARIDLSETYTNAFVP
jgi:hypothetical protein